MPNWVYNTLTIEGNPDMVISLKNGMNNSFTVPLENHDMGDVYASGGFPQKIKEVKYTNPVFAFWNIVNPFEQGITAEQYACQPATPNVPIEAPNFWEEHHKVSSVDNSWYNWNNRNWGCKWDVAVSDDDKYPETELLSEGANGENYVLVYRFNTPWGIPEQALLNLSAQFPALLFTLDYEEETGWGGEAEFLRGECISISEYGWKCRDCDHEEDETPYCEECDYDICPSCGYGEPDEACEKHKELTDATAN